MKQLTEEEKEYNSKRKLVQEKLIKFARRKTPRLVIDSGTSPDGYPSGSRSR